MQIKPRTRRPVKEHNSSAVAIPGVTHPDQPVTDTNIELDSRHAPRR
jgi:hypothetical protein